MGESRFKLWSSDSKSQHLPFSSILLPTPFPTSFSSCLITTVSYFPKASRSDLHLVPCVHLPGVSPQWAHPYLAGAGAQSSGDWLEWFGNCLQSPCRWEAWPPRCWPHWGGTRWTPGHSDPSADSPSGYSGVSPESGSVKQEPKGQPCNWSHGGSLPPAGPAASQWPRAFPAFWSWTSINERVWSIVQKERTEATERLGEYCLVDW